MAAVLGFPLWRGLRARAETLAHPLRPDLALILSATLISLALAWLTVPVLGATVFRIRYMYPMVFIVPLWAFMIVERGRPSERALHAFAAVLLVLALAVPVERVLAPHLIKGPDNCWPCKIRTPFAPAAAKLRAEGYYGEGTILADSVYTGGNLRVHFPDARVVVPPFPPETWPAAAGDGPCLLVWPVGNGEPPLSVPEHQASYLADALHSEPGGPFQEGVVSAPLYGPEKGTFRMAYRLYGSVTGDCR
jgi:hypothetical protein